MRHATVQASSNRGTYISMGQSTLHQHIHIEIVPQKAGGSYEEASNKEASAPGFLQLYHHVSKYLVLLLSFKTAVAYSIQACFSSQVYIFLPHKMHIKFFSLLAVFLDLLSISIATPTPNPATTATLETCSGIRVSLLGIPVADLVTSLMCCQGFVANPGEGTFAGVTTITPTGEGIGCTFFFPCLLSCNLVSRSQISLLKQKAKI